MVDFDFLILRRGRLEDEAFLLELYSSTRAEELDSWGWDVQQRSHFLKMQFEAQQRAYRSCFPDSDRQIVLWENCPIGSILAVSNQEEIRLVDIALLPVHRNKGIGTLLIQNLLTEAEETSKPVRLQVIKFNRAVRLYERLGFLKREDTGIYFVMEWVSPLH